MKLITRQDLADVAAERFRETHARFLDLPAGWNPSFTRREILEQLRALGQHPLPAQVDAVIGNVSWTRITCNSCAQEVCRAVAIDMTYHEYPTHVCENCVSNMAALFFP